MKIENFIFVIFLAQCRGIGKYCEAPEGDPDEQCYMKETLLSITHSPNQLAIDKNTNHLYFSFDQGSGEYLAAVYKMKNKEITVLKGIKDAFAITADSENNEIFFGGSHGLYRYNPAQKSLKRLNMNHLDVWWLFVKHNIIYFIKFPSLNTYYYVNGSISIVSELKNNVVHQMVYDSDDDMFFINNTGLYGVKARSDNAVLLKENIRFLNMAVDNMGHVYVCAEDGIYVITKIIQKVKKVMSLKGVLGFTFDKSNNIIYSDSHEIVRLIRI